MHGVLTRTTEALLFLHLLVLLLFCSAVLLLVNLEDGFKRCRNGCSSEQEEGYEHITVEIHVCKA